MFNEYQSETSTYIQPHSVKANIKELYIRKTVKSVDIHAEKSIIWNYIRQIVGWLVWSAKKSSLGGGTPCLKNNFKKLVDRYLRMKYFRTASVDLCLIFMQKCFYRMCQEFWPMSACTPVFARTVMRGTIFGTLCRNKHEKILPEQVQLGWTKLPRCFDILSREKG
jgi:hypothetical protein